MARLAPLDFDHLDPEQRRVADAILAGPRGGGTPGGSVGGPFAVWLRSPGLADPAQQVGAYCRFGTVLPPELSELAIILVGKFWQCPYEFVAHARLALAAGVDEAVVEAIRAGTPPPYTDDRAATVHAIVMEYLNDHRLSDATYKRGIRAFEERGMVDLVGIIGYYCLICVTLNVFEVPVPEGQVAPVL